jgi:hypothetical protein
MTMDLSAGPWSKYEPSPSPFWAAGAAATLVNQQLALSRYAEVAGDGAAADRVATANATAVRDLADRLTAVPFDGFGDLFATIVVVVWPLNPQPIPPHWDDLVLPDGLPGLDLLLAGAQFQRAAGHPAAGRNADGYQLAAGQLLDAGLQRLAKWKHAG